MTHEKLSIAEMNRLSAEAFHEADKLPLIVVLDNVRSQHNVGAVFRTADAFLLEGVWTCGISPTPDNVEVHKTALGAEQTVNWLHFEDTLEAVRELKTMGYEVYAVEQAHNSITLAEFTQQESKALCKKKLAIIMGHEVFGVQQAVVDACDGCIEIPQYGTKHSLNVSVTAGIVMYNIAQMMR